MAVLAWKNQNMAAINWSVRMQEEEGGKKKKKAKKRKRRANLHLALTTPHTDCRVQLIRGQSDKSCTLIGQ